MRASRPIRMLGASIRPSVPQTLLAQAPLDPEVLGQDLGADQRRGRHYDPHQTEDRAEYPLADEEQRRSDIDRSFHHQRLHQISLDEVDADVDCPREREVPRRLRKPRQQSGYSAGDGPYARYESAEEGEDAEKQPLFDPHQRESDGGERPHQGHRDDDAAHPLAQTQARAPPRLVEHGLVLPRNHQPDSAPVDLGLVDEEGAENDDEDDAGDAGYDGNERRHGLFSHLRRDFGRLLGHPAAL